MAGPAPWCAPAARFSRGGGSLGMWDPSRPKYPQKIRNRNICRKKKQTKRNRPRFGRGTLVKHACKTSGSIFQKRRGHWTLKEFGAISLNQRVLRERINETIFTFPDHVISCTVSQQDRHVVPSSYYSLWYQLFRHYG